MVTSKIDFTNTDTAFARQSNFKLRIALFIFWVIHHPWIANLAVRSIKIGLALRLPFLFLLRKTIFCHFCAGETYEDSLSTIEDLYRHRVYSILDYAVEGTQKESDFDHIKNVILDNLEHIKKKPHLPFCVFKLTGIANDKILAAVQANRTLTQIEEQAYHRVTERLQQIGVRAHAYAIPILIDAEESWIQNIIDHLTYDMMRQFNRQQAIVFNTYQMYRKDMLSNLEKAYQKAQQEGYTLGVKLVRGAYMEKERKRASTYGYTSPICTTKEETDDLFNRALAFCVDKIPSICLICCSHNEYSNLYLTSLMEKHNLPPNHPNVWFSQLLGMSDNITFNLASAGYQVTKYVPYGPIKQAIPYLIRRAHENTSVSGQTNRELSLIRKELARRKKTTKIHTL